LGLEACQGEPPAPVAAAAPVREVEEVKEAKEIPTPAPPTTTTGVDEAVPVDPATAQDPLTPESQPNPAYTIEPLLKEIAKKKTKDDRAMAALGEAKTLGALPADLAKAANARGMALFSEPERAQTWFEWAKGADPEFPDASFNLAKLAANAGEIDTVLEHLKDVKARGGKKLLKTVGFDPTFALVADDPVVQKLAK
jgi:hypothetical protein